MNGVPSAKTKPSGASRAVALIRVGVDRHPASDYVAVEEPMEVRVNGVPFAVIMRTPGADRELAAGFLLAEDVIRTSDELLTIEECEDTTVEARGNTLNVAVDGHWRVPVDIVRQLPSRLRAAQYVFDTTGGLHAAGLFDRAGTLRHVAEDVGRHNAVDKIIGRRVMEDALPLDDFILVLSGRTSFELVQKALLAGIPF